MSRLNRSLTPAQRAALEKLVDNPVYELVPVAGFDEAAAALPARALVTVTASPRLGIEATLDAAEQLAARGHHVSPHLAARSIRDRAHLADIMGRMQAAGIRTAFVVGGDGQAIGEFRDGLSLVREMTALDERFQEIGVPSYPEGHPSIPDRTLLDDLRAKQRYARTTTTQMSFNPAAIASWIARIRDEGIVLPIHLGVPGVLPLRKLTAIGARIGVADSTRYLLKNRGLLGHLVGGGAFGPDALLAGLADTIADSRSNVVALHMFTMNQVADTSKWLRTMADELMAR
jgi:methylenetetrahydrofolate reductase (NADPH)